MTAPIETKLPRLPLLKEGGIDLVGFSRISSLRSTVILFNSALMLALVLYSGYLAWVNAYYLLWFLVLWLIAALQHRLSIIQHEAVHKMLFRNRLMNDVVGLWIAGAAVGAPPGAGRHAHLAHHASLGTEHDGEPGYMSAPKTKAGLLRWVVFKLFGIESALRLLELSLNSLRSRKPVTVENQKSVGYVAQPAKQDLIIVACTQACIALTFTLTIGWYYYLLLWVLPLFTVTRLLMGLRNFAEHAEQPEKTIPEEHYLNSIYCNRVEEFFFSPLCFNYHAEHHLFPGVPTWRLPKLSRELRTLPYFTEHVRMHDSFVSLLFSDTKHPELQQCVMQPDDGQSSQPISKVPV
jgi:fatty acid desaturase